MRDTQYNPSEAPAHGVSRAVDLELPIRSSIAGIGWPALPSPDASALLAALYQLEQSQWWPQQRMLELQLRQLSVVLAHSYKASPFMRRRLDNAGFDSAAPLSIERLHKLPLLTRADLQDAGDDLFCREMPSDHGGISETQTSGSTGQPVKIRGTSVTNFFWRVLTLREHLWHRRDLAGKLCGIRATANGIAAPPDGVVAANWGSPTNLLYTAGPGALLSLASDVSTQAAWLLRHDPHYLVVYPSNLMALIAHFRATGLKLQHLRQVCTVGETVTPALRAACHDEWGVAVVDLYSSQEVGYIALQCPDYEHYHLQSESLLVEILDDSGRPCQPGEIGRVVVSDLHNFATPIIRYELRDYAQAGAPCTCGRGLATVTRIVGRSRNMLTLPSGEKRWPLVGFKQYREIAPIRQYQLIQRAPTRIEVRFVADRPVTTREEAQLRSVIQESLGYAFEISFVYLDDIPRAAAGKFEEFVSEVGA
ncbi:MAG: phenylacetate--CoA ligase family protein [Burkholderiales bacterium]